MQLYNEHQRIKKRYFAKVLWSWIFKEAKAGGENVDKGRKGGGNEWLLLVSVLLVWVLNKSWTLCWTLGYFILFNPCKLLRSCLHGTGKETKAQRSDLSSDRKAWRLGCLWLQCPDCSPEIMIEQNQGLRTWVLRQSTWVVFYDNLQGSVTERFQVQESGVGELPSAVFICFIHMSICSFAW